nr:MAG TPA: tRNAHis guanylyltransferase [Caudoviricetes sp.]
MGKEKKNTLGTRMKEYEAVSKNHLMRRTPVVIRLDGKAFHTFTRGLNKPFDSDFVTMMQQTMLHLCENIQGCVLGYTQSDEITLVLVDYQNRDSCAWFDNQVQKIASISASMATLYFNRELSEMLRDLEEDLAAADYSLPQAHMYETNSKKYDKWYDKEYRAVFDSRVFNLPQYEVINNLIWRQQDATRNSINSVAQSLFSHKELQGISSKDLQNKMLTERDVNWNDYPTHLKRGCCAIKDSEGKWVLDINIPIFTEDRNYIDRLVFLEDGEENAI